VSVTEQLIEARCDIDLQDEDGDITLHAAVSTGQAAVTKQPIDTRCNIDLPNEDWYTPLHIAAQQGHASRHEAAD
jgi:ankyrin repeat protein